MTYVMGLEAAKIRPATDQERKEMQRLLHEGMDAGLCGFSIQRLGPNSVQADFDGTPDGHRHDVSTRTSSPWPRCSPSATRASSRSPRPPATSRPTSPFLEKLAAVAKRPDPATTSSPRPRSDPEVHRRPLRWIEQCRDKGLPMFAQCATGRAGFAFTLEHWNLYDASPAWRAVTTGTKDEKIEKMQDPELRRGARRRGRGGRPAAAGHPGRRRRQPAPTSIIQGVNRQADLQQYVGRSVGDIAEEEGKHHDRGDARPVAGRRPERRVPRAGQGLERRVHGRDDERSPYSIPGVSDGGAHTKFFTGGAYTTDFLRWLVRDEGVLTLEEAHYRLSTLAAHAAGFQDRGTLREGAAADVVVYDLEELAIDPQWIGEVEYDLPGGEWRRVQRAKGYQHIIVNGEVTFEDGECTGATPGSCCAAAAADRSTSWRAPDATERPDEWSTAGVATDVQRVLDAGRSAA